MSTTNVTLSMEKVINDLIRKEATKAFDQYVNEQLEQFRKKLLTQRDDVVSGIAIKLIRAVEATGKTSITIKLEQS